MKIKANELRIGNWYKGVSRDIFLKADGRMIAQLQEGILVAQAIPLTEEILLKCGFENSNRDFFEKRAMQRGKINISFNKGVMEFLELGTSNHYIFGSVKHTHLHQLQNLYFSLTGEELEIKL